MKKLFYRVRFQGLSWGLLSMNVPRGCNLLVNDTTNIDGQASQALFSHGSPFTVGKCDMPATRPVSENQELVSTDSA
ncbi:MAG: hypothetical protein IPH84_04475 [Bacteroidales bacterium]|nr:hypothetical protein [Bacteroidales bacterium]